MQTVAEVSRAYFYSFLLHPLARIEIAVILLPSICHLPSVACHLKWAHCNLPSVPRAHRNLPPVLRAHRNVPRPSTLSLLLVCCRGYAWGMRGGNTRASRRHKEVVAALASVKLPIACDAVASFVTDAPTSNRTP
jgi:hypothetical protein